MMLVDSTLLKSNLPTTIAILVVIAPISAEYSDAFYRNNGVQRFPSRPINLTRRNTDEDEPLISDEDWRKLMTLYGRDKILAHKKDIENIQAMDHNAPEHKISWKSSPSGPEENVITHEQKLEVKLKYFLKERLRKQQEQAHRSKRTKRSKDDQVSQLLERLMVKLEDEDNRLRTKMVDLKKQHSHCTLRGLWISKVAGAAIDMIPNADGTISTQIHNLRGRKRAVITEDWEGRGILSPNVHNTMTIIFQEKVPTEHLKTPRTAVFVGQCIVCDHASILQGTWLLFPKHQMCPDYRWPSNQEGKKDTMYFVK